MLFANYSGDATSIQYLNVAKLYMHVRSIQGNNEQEWGPAKSQAIYKNQPANMIIDEARSAGCISSSRQ